MKHTSKTATATLEKLRAAAMPGGYAKFKAEGYMDLYAELIDDREPLTGRTVELWAVAHTYTQNGDLMRDPEIVFLRVQDPHNTPQWYPVEYRNDPYGVQGLAVLGSDLMPTQYYPRAQRDATAFVTQWMKNLEMQGHLNRQQTLEAATA